MTRDWCDGVEEWWGGGEVGRIEETALINLVNATFVPSLTAATTDTVVVVVAAMVVLIIVEMCLTHMTFTVSITRR